MTTLLLKSLTLFALLALIPGIANAQMEMLNFNPPITHVTGQDWQGDLGVDQDMVIANLGPETYKITIVKPDGTIKEITVPPYETIVVDMGCTRVGEKIKMSVFQGVDTIGHITLDVVRQIDEAPPITDTLLTLGNRPTHPVTAIRQGMTA